MCLGCRERMPQSDLVRIQLTREGIVIIEHKSHRREGRSIYFCPKSGCLDRALRKSELVFKKSKCDKIIVRLDSKQIARLRFAFGHAARRLRGEIGVGPKDNRKKDRK